MRKSVLKCEKLIASKASSFSNDIIILELTFELSRVCICLSIPGKGWQNRKYTALYIITLYRIAGVIVPLLYRLGGGAVLKCRIKRNYNTIFPKRNTFIS